MAVGSKWLIGVIKKPTFVKVVKLLILITLGYVIYRQLYLKNDINVFLDTFILQFNINNFYLFFLAFALVPLNWNLEIFKWSTLVNEYQDLSYDAALKGILSGVCLAIITPARIGEYGGRLITIDKENIPKSISSTFVSSMIQNAINISFGVIALLLFHSKFKLLSPYQVKWVIVGGILFLMSVLIVYKYRSKIYRFITSRWASDRLSKVKEIIKDSLLVSPQIVTRVVFYSLLRYIVYVAQYILLISFYGVSSDVIGSIFGVGVIFLFQTMVPLPPALSVFARGEVAILVWSTFSANMIGILVATFTLWIINLMIPALVGYIIIWRSNILKQ